jgi:hypothetical protein
VLPTIDRALHVICAWLRCSAPFHSIPFLVRCIYMTLPVSLLTPIEMRMSNTATMSRMTSFEKTDFFFNVTAPAVFFALAVSAAFEPAVDA